MDVIGAAASSAAPKEGKDQMRFEVTSDDHILSITDDLQTEADEHSSTFETEQERRGR